jgi:hypothetical protein
MTEKIHICNHGNEHMSSSATGCFCYPAEYSTNCSRNRLLSTVETVTESHEEEFHEDSH